LSIFGAEVIGTAILILLGDGVVAAVPAGSAGPPSGPPSHGRPTAIADPRHGPLRRGYAGIPAVAPIAGALYFYPG
jgi:glycerol uptake facilitator-like aquaporin